MASSYSFGTDIRAQQTFESAVSSSASIVKPTVPKNVLAEFQSKLRGQNPFDDDTAASTLPPPAPPVPIAAPPRRAPAPPVPIQQQQVYVPPPQPQRPVDFSQFGDFSVSAIPTLNQSTLGSQGNEEKTRLINAMQQHLRLKAAHGQAMTVGELSGQIRDLTGQSWGGHWELKYGTLLNFLKANPDAFTVVRSKYVTCRGQEDVAYRQLERESLEQSAMLEAQQRAQTTYAQVPMMYQQQPAQPSFYAPGFDATNPFGVAEQPSYYQQEQRSSMNADTYWDNPQRSNSVISRKDSTEWQLPQTGAYSSFDPFAPIDPFANRYAEAPSFIPPAQSTMGEDWWSQPSAVYPPMPQARDPFNFQGFNDSLAPPSAIVPPAGINTSSQLSEEDLEDIKKADRRAARRAKKQEEEDERYARELQAKEFEEASTRRQTVSEEEGWGGEYVVLTTAQMRDLAEKELGIDNVRIIAGFTVKKYGREGRPHQRKMWITQSLTHLAWASSLLEGSHRGIELKHVTEVTSGQMTPTIARSTSDKNKVRAQCFSLVTASRTLDMQACSIIQRDALVNALRAVVAFTQKYRPEKVDRDLTKIRAVGYASIFNGK